MRSHSQTSVRILRKRSPPQTATISLLIATLAGLGIIITWRYWHQEEPAPIRRRTLSDVQMDWRCESGHLFRRAGIAEPRRCPVCEKPAYPITRFTCPDHGEFEVSVKFATGEEGEAYVTHYRLPGRNWTPAKTAPLCPQCGRAMFDPSLDPLSKFKRGKKPRGG